MQMSSSNSAWYATRREDAFSMRTANAAALYAFTILDGSAATGDERDIFGWRCAATTGSTGGMLHKPWPSIPSQSSTELAVTECFSLYSLFRQELF